MKRSRTVEVDGKRRTCSNKEAQKLLRHPGTENELAIRRLSMLQDVLRDGEHHVLTLSVLFGDLELSGLDCLPTPKDLLRREEGRTLTARQFDLECKLSKHANPWLVQFCRDLQLLRRLQDAEPCC